MLYFQTCCTGSGWNSSQARPVPLRLIQRARLKGCLNFPSLVEWSVTSKICARNHGDGARSPLGQSWHLSKRFCHFQSISPLSLNTARAKCEHRQKKEGLSRWWHVEYMWLLQRSEQSLLLHILGKSRRAGGRNLMTTCSSCAWSCPGTET